MGFEPTTSTLARLRSTPELHPHCDIHYVYTIKKTIASIFFIFLQKLFFGLLLSKVPLLHSCSPRSQEQVPFRRKVQGRCQIHQAFDPIHQGQKIMHGNVFYGAHVVDGIPQRIRQGQLHGTPVNRYFFCNKHRSPFVITRLLYEL